MPKKREASPEEIAALAKQFRALWRKGDALRPWMRQHRQMVLGLVHGDYSWDAIAKALSKAKIKYQGGEAEDWMAEGLRREFVRAARPRKFDKSPANVTDTGEIANVTGRLDAPRPAADTPAVLIAPAMAAPVSLPPAPQFKPFSLKTHEPPPDLSPAEIDERDALRRRMFGS